MSESENIPGYRRLKELLPHCLGFADEEHFEIGNRSQETGEEGWHSLLASIFVRCRPSTTAGKPELAETRMR